MGSEPEVGLRSLLAAVREHEVWVLTQPHMAELMTPYLAEQGLAGRVHVVAVPPSAPVRQDGLLALSYTQYRHELWQRTAATRARELHAQIGFDVVHHATLAAYWMRTGVAGLDVPMVWGPVGGALEPPLGLLTVLGGRGVLEDGVRAVVRLAAWSLPSRRAVLQQAQVVLAQNDATARRLRGAEHIQVLPNALSARVEGVHATGERRRDIAVAGRVVAWKAVPLAVRALAHVPDDDVVLRIYGSAAGDQRRRVELAAARYGVADRVHLVGRMPRDALLEQVATSGVLLHPSLHDEAPVAVAEALALGTPVVALSHGGPAQVAAAWGARGAVSLVRPSTPGRTAARLGAAVVQALADPPPVATEAVPAMLDFAEELLAAYERAVRTRTGR